MKLNMKKVAIGLALIVFALLVYRYIVREGFEGGAGPSFTFYYADWCPHCKPVKPVFTQFMSENSNSLTVNGTPVMLKMVESANVPASSPVKGYPTFIYTDANGKTKECDAPRTPDGWTSWLKANL